VETGRGQKMHNWSPGNLSAGPSYQGDIWRPSWYKLTSTSSARDKALNAAMLRNEVPSAFRAYGSLSEGLADYLRLLQTERYKPLWAAFGTADDATIVRQLHDTGYSPDYGPAHVATFQALRSELGNLFPESEGSDWKGGALLVGAIALVAGYALLQLARDRQALPARVRELLRST
jgi:hypothetical protein